MVAGQTLDRIEIVLRRGAVISGRVVDDTGAPVPDVTVNALRRVFRRGRSRLEPAQRSATTDDRGEYRLWGLAEGVYFVSAESKAPPGPFAATSGTGYAPMFAPGTSAVTEAVRITAVGGQDVSADIRLVLDKLVRVAGHVVLSTGETSPGGQVRLIARGEMRRDGPSGPIMDGGRFSLPDVPPGSYTLIARSGLAQFAGPAGPRPVAAEIAVMPIEVGRDDLSGVRVVTTRGISANGVDVAQHGALPTHAPVRVQLVAMDPDQALGGSQLVSIDAAGRFAAGDVVGGMLLQPLLPRGWMLSSVTYDGVDVTERPFELRADGGPVRVVITDRVTSVTGTVTDDRGRPLTDCDVLIFSEDSARWHSGARSIRHTRPAQNGSYRAESLAPGRYHVVALRSLDEDAISDPAVLNALRPVSESIDLATGNPQRLDLRLAVVTADGRE